MKRWLHDWLLRGWYGRRPIWLLTPLSVLFAILSGLRRSLYRTGILLPGALPVPVIVVGNISVGGSGKTPFTIWLAQSLREAGYHPGILTRGYGGKARTWPREVTADSTAQDVGDEAVLLARRTGVPVVAGPDRLAAAQLLIDRHPINVIVSDDGLQHYRLPRRVEIIMLDGQRGLGNRWCLPAGPLREPARRLRRCDFTVLKGGDSRPAGVPDAALNMQLALTGAVSLADGRVRDIGDFAAEPVHAVAGIADPTQFFAALVAQGLEVDGRALPDHAQPRPQDWRFGDAQAVLMTEKDAVKCKGMPLENHWYVTAEARFDPDVKQRLLAGIIARLSRHEA
ncbi:MAG TPA: tetraacyldisaccharide 4'-kinase [Gammaproteobacteria bacterium]|nr:tetraacyldisaccharide 4'-kinase [Gammaproteobacteria bacterium]